MDFEGVDVRFGVLLGFILFAQGFTVFEQESMYLM